MTLGFIGDPDNEFTNKGIFVPVWANDLDKDAVNTYNANFGEHCIRGDINTLLRDPKIEIPAADVVIGGPPCQGFSLLNKKRDGDMRRHLWKPFLEVVKRSGASIFVMENVPGLLKSAEYDDLAAAAEEMKFTLIPAKLCAADYGVPQVRWRAFILGVSKHFKEHDILSLHQIFPPKKTHFNPSNGTATKGLEFAGHTISEQPWRTVKDVIGDLIDEPLGLEICTGLAKEQRRLALHVGRNPTDLSLRRYAMIPEGGNRFNLPSELNIPCWERKTSGGTDLFGRLWWDRPAVTIRTEFFKPEKGRYLHPSKNRPITHREAARLQSFPDWFEFHGSKVQVAKQIGNAVPPLLAASIACSVRNLLDTARVEE
jgi:DNA (cytosine-5)-methyltransferase 1